MKCPKCGSENVNIETFQEEQGSKTITRRRFKVSETGKHHGFFWWVFVGWWWIPIKFTLWIICFPIMLIASLFGRVFGRKSYKGKEKEKSVTRNRIGYTTVCVCQNCGKRWTTK